VLTAPVARASSPWQVDASPRAASSPTPDGAKKKVDKQATDRGSCDQMRHLHHAPAHAHAHAHHAPAHPASSHSLTRAWSCRAFEAVVASTANSPALAAAKAAPSARELLSFMSPWKAEEERQAAAVELANRALSADHASSAGVAASFSTAPGALVKLARALAPGAAAGPAAASAVAALACAMADAASVERLAATDGVLPGLAAMLGAWRLVRRLRPCPHFACLS
jgi:hypothetical protein